MPTKTDVADISASAPVVSYDHAVVPLADGDAACLYVVVDALARPDVADFMHSWHKCCDDADFSWDTVRRPRTGLVTIDLRHCCTEGEAPAIRLVFDINRDREALDRLAATEVLVVGTREWGRFGNVVVDYAIDGNAVRRAISDARVGLKELSKAS